MNIIMNKTSIKIRDNLIQLQQEQNINWVQSINQQSS